jgi:phosphatidate cytidylyltransferase
VSAEHGYRPNLLRRVLTAAIALPILFGVLFLGPPLALVAIVAVALLLALIEFQRLLLARSLRPMPVTGLLLSAALFVEVALPGRIGVPLAPIGALLLLSVMLRRSADLPGSVPAAAATLFGSLYLGALGGTIAALRLITPEADGPWRVTLLLAIVMFSDTLAFFVGHALGRHRLAPTLSPSKTIEGALGGLAGGMLGALATRALGLPSLRLSHALGLGLVVAGLGILGDLAESLLKRWAGVKDSGAIFPGHGGMLDRLDSLLFGAPVLYYYFLYVR